MCCRGCNQLAVGLLPYSSTADTTAKFTTTFVNNTAVGSGGALQCEDCRGQFLAHAAFKNNSVAGHGGAVATRSITYRSASYLLHCSFVGNRAEYIPHAPTADLDLLGSGSHAPEERGLAKVMLKLALASGGAFSADGGVHVLVNNALESNSAVNGGAVAWLATRVSLPLYRLGLGVRPTWGSHVLCALGAAGAEGDYPQLPGDLGEEAGTRLGAGGNVCRIGLAGEFMVVPGVPGSGLFLVGGVVKGNVGEGGGSVVFA